MNKKNLLITSAIISLFLLNITTVQAEEDSSLEATEAGNKSIHNSVEIPLGSSAKDESLQNEYIKDKSNDNLKEFDKIIKELNLLLKVEQKETLYELYSSEMEISILFKEAVIAHESSEFIQASKLYNQLLGLDSLNEPTVELLDLFNTLSLAEANLTDQENYVTVTDDIDEEPQDSIENQESQDNPEDLVDGEAIENPNQEESEDIEESTNPSDTSEQGQQAEIMTINHQKTIAEYDAAIRNSNSVSERWNLAQEMKSLFETDSLVIEAINLAADSSLNYAITQHQRGNYSQSLTYYTRVIEEELVSEQVKIIANIRRNQGEAQEVYKSAEDYYQAIKNSVNASEIWNLAQELKTLYVSGPYVDQAIQYAAESNLNYAIAQHQRGNYERSLTYYTRIIEEETLSTSIRRLAATHRTLAEEKKAYRTAEDYYNAINNSDNVSEMWDLAQESKALYLSGRYVEQAINYAAERNLNYAIVQHQRGNYERSLTYYTRIIEEDLVQKNMKNIALTHREQAEAKEVYRSAEYYYNAVINSGNVSEMWNLAQESKTLFSSDLFVEKAVVYAVERNLNYAIAQHQRGNYVSSLTYYSRIVEEELSPTYIKEIAKIRIEQAEDKDPYKSAEDYYNTAKNSGSVSEIWNLAQESKVLFLSGRYVEQIINYAAGNNMNYAIAQHQRGNYHRSLTYYSRIIKEELVEDSVREVATNFHELAVNKNRIATADDYYNRSVSSSLASEKWDIVIEGLTVYPNNQMLLNALNDAANRNLILGRRQQENNNFPLAHTYYNKVINETKIKDSIRTIAKVFSKQLSSDYRPTVFIDVGHGGSDPGATSSGVQEKQLNLNTANYLKAKLEMRGYNVLMSRTTDQFIELTDRANAANEALADIFVSVHYNSMGGSGTARGIETFIHQTVSSGFGQETNRNNFKTDDIRIEESLKLADQIHSNLINQTGMYDRKVKGNNFNVVRNTHIPAVLLELGFMDNRTELSKIITSSYQRTAAKAVADGIDNYFKR